MTATPSTGVEGGQRRNLLRVGSWKNEMSNSCDFDVFGARLGGVFRDGASPLVRKGYDGEIMSEAANT